MNVTITKVVCRGYEVIYHTEDSVNAEPVVELNDSQSRALSRTRLRHFEAEYDAVGLYLAAN